jgi:hypothetical protein
VWLQRCSSTRKIRGNRALFALSPSGVHPAQLSIRNYTVWRSHLLLCNGDYATCESVRAAREWRLRLSELWKSCARNPSPPWRAGEQQARLATSPRGVLVWRPYVTNTTKQHRQRPRQFPFLTRGAPLEFGTKARTSGHSPSRTGRACQSSYGAENGSSVNGAVSAW